MWFTTLRKQNLFCSFKKFDKYFVQSIPCTNQWFTNDSMRMYRVLGAWRSSNWNNYLRHELELLVNYNQLTVVCNRRNHLMMSLDVNRMLVYDYANCNHTHCSDTHRPLDDQREYLWSVPYGDDEAPEQIEQFKLMSQVLRTTDSFVWIWDNNSIPGTTKITWLVCWRCHRFSCGA